MRKGKILIAFVVCVAAISCNKGVEDELMKKSEREYNTKFSVSRLSYGENLFYVSEKSSSNLISPVSKPDFGGHFTSIPSGLALDRETGNIDLSNSQAGQPYKIFYVNQDGILADSVRIVVSGLDYIDGIYDTENQSSKFGQKSIAVYNGDESNPIPSNVLNSFSVSYQVTNDDSEDETGLVINKRDGSLDLRKSKSNGLFGEVPAEGAYKELVIKYRLADKSARKLNIQKIKFFYFEDESKIPQSLRLIIEERQMIMQRVNVMPLPGNTSETTNSEAATEESLNDYNKPVRPPLIIVT